MAGHVGQDSGEPRGVVGDCGLLERRFVLGAEKLRSGRGREGVWRVRSGVEELEEEEEMTGGEEVEEEEGGWRARLYQVSLCLWGTCPYFLSMSRTNSIVYC